VGIGPVLRHELPLFVAKLQLLGDVAPVGIADASLPLPSDPAVWILVRRDAAITYGKLVAQAGHGLWAPVAKGLRRKPGAIHAWNDAGAAVAAAWVGDLDAMTHAHEAAISDGLASGFIVDEGRTVFAGRPTPTVVGIGPCHRADLPAEVLAAFERRVLRTDQDFAQHPTI
jgi:peptidyl-tRNA hydrolase